jgi:2-dehydro-3-deoxyglucarate aldolase
LTNHIIKQLDLHQPCIGAWLTVASPFVGEAMASTGFHWLAVDMEHNPLSIEDAALAFMAAENHGVAPFVRLPNADPILARRLLDAGARGLIVPMVEDPGELLEFTVHCTNPPKGRRGVSLSRFNLWGDRFEEELNNSRPIIVPMIETKKGLENIDEITSLSQTDAIFIGPYDLSASLGVAGEFEATVFVDCLEKIKAAAAKNNVPIGIHQVQPDLGELKSRIDEGYTFIAYSTDLIAMRHALNGIKDI